MNSNMKRGPSRRKFIGSLAGLGAGVSLVKKTPAQQEPRPEFTGPLSKEKLPEKIEVSKPNGLNLIVIICDTFRWDYLHFNGNERIMTPKLDQLVKDAVYFENCFADGLPTIPARRVMHTGRSYLDIKSPWKPLERDEITLAEILGRAGFTTGFIVDTFHHFKPDMNLHRGFSSWEWIRGQESDPYVSGPRERVRPENHTPKHLLNDYYRERIIQYVLNTKDRRGEKDYFCAQSCSAAARWLRNNKDNGGPFMLFIDMFDPHEPWDAPPRYQKMYRKKFPCERTIFGYGVELKDIREDDYPFIRDLYSAEVTFSDHCVGGLIHEVKKLGLWNNTIIAFSTDHGTHLGEQGCVQKQAKLLNSCLARVPLIIRHPDNSFRGKRVTELASHLDFVPTFLSLLGVKTNLSFHGGNLWELVNGRKLRDHVVTGYGNFGAVHTRKWHYFQNVWGKDPGLGPQLYDLEKDPREEKDVVKSYPEIAAGMKKLMEKSFRTKLP